MNERCANKAKKYLCKLAIFLVRRRPFKYHYQEVRFFFGLIHRGFFLGTKTQLVATIKNQHQRVMSCSQNIIKVLLSFLETALDQSLIETATLIIAQKFLHVQIFNIELWNKYILRTMALQKSFKVTPAH
jgi:hypothetical protein